MRIINAHVLNGLEEAICRAYALGRVDQSIEVAATELRRMVAAEPRITRGEILRRYGARPSPWSNVPDWDEVLWRVADVWCELQRGLQGRPTRELPASPYSSLNILIRNAYEAGHEAGHEAVRERVLSVFDDDEPAREAAATQR